MASNHLNDMQKEQNELEFDWQATMETTKENHEFLLNNQIMSDVTFVFAENNGKKKKFLYAHSWILSARSSVFYRTFKGNFEVSKQIPIEDVTAEIFLEFLKLLYVDQCTITDNNVIQILSLSKKYVIPYLEKICCEFIEKDLHINSACDVLENLIQLDYKNVIKSCLNFISTRSHSILKSELFLKIRHETLRTILTMNEYVALSEFDIFTCVMLWADAECIRRDLTVNGKNKRTVLGDDIIKLIRFPTMTIEEFLKCVAVEDLLTPQEILSIILTFSIKTTNEFGFNMNKRTIDITDLTDLPLVIVDLKKNISCSRSFSYTEFSVNKLVFITGIQLQDHNENINVNNINKQHTCKLFNDKYELLGEKTCNDRMIEFKHPVFLDKNCVYKISIQNFSGQITSIGHNSHPKNHKITEDDLAVTFKQIYINLKKIFMKLY